MKKKIYATVAYLMAMLFTTVSFGQTFHEKYYHDGSYIFDDIQKIRLPEIFTTYKSEFGLGDNDSMVQTNNVVGQDGEFTTKFILQHKGISVEGSMMNVIGSKGIVQYANGFLLTGLNADVTNIISEQEAINIAIDIVNADLYPWQDSTLIAELIAEGEDPDETLYPQHAELLITKMRGENYEHTSDNYQLCYKVIIHAIEPSSITNVFVNANTGEIFTSENGVLEGEYHVTGKVWTWYNGLHNNIKTRTCSSCNKYWLHDRDRNIFTTVNWKKYWQKGSWNKDDNNMWAQFVSESDIRTAATGHWSLQRAWEYYINRHGRWGTNYAGRRIHVRTEYPTTSFNAAWNFDDNEDNIYIRPDNSNSAAMLDVLSHEYTHGMIGESSNLGVLGDFDARSMNEGYADIFGMRIEGYTIGAYDWTFAEHMGTYQRNFEDPNSDFGQYYTNNGTSPGASAAIYLQPGYWSKLNPHANGGVLRKWFYLLSNGGTFNGNTVLPLGIETADDIAYITFNWWLWSNLKYPEMANQTVHATIAHWGKCSNEHKQVVKALRAVGFSIPNPWCFRIEIEGPVIIDDNGGVFEWSAKLNDIEDLDGNYEWHIPSDWQATATGNKLTLVGYNNTNSQEVSVTYTATDGSKYSDTVIVHFSDVAWIPTNNMPAQQMSKSFEEVIKPSNGLLVYPNPANQKVQLTFTQFEEEAIIEIFDINGRLIQTYNTTQPQFEINISDFTNGIYIIKANSGEHSYTKKLSVIH